MVVVGGAGVVRGLIALPRNGIWHADFDLDTGEVPEGPIEINIAGVVKLQGAVASAGIHHGGVRARVVAGAGGMQRMAKPKHYTRPVVRTLLNDLVNVAGEKLSGTITQALLGRSLIAWTVLGVEVGIQVAGLVARGMPAGTSWRMLPDGTLWVGSETWPDSGIVEWRELERSARESRLEVGLDEPVLLPGTKLGEDRIDYVEHHIEDGRVWARAWFV